MGGWRKTNGGRSHEQQVLPRGAILFYFFKECHFRHEGGQQGGSNGQGRRWPQPLNKARRRVWRDEWLSLRRPEGTVQPGQGRGAGREACVIAPQAWFVRGATGASGGGGKSSPELGLSVWGTALARPLWWSQRSGSWMSSLNYASYSGFFEGAPRRHHRWSFGVTVARVLHPRRRQLGEGSRRMS